MVILISITVSHPGNEDHRVRIVPTDLTCFLTLDGYYGGLVLTEDFGKKLDLKIRAGIPIIQIISPEWRRVLGFAVHVAKENKRELSLWNNAEGLRKWDFDSKTISAEDESKQDPVDVLSWFIRDAPEDSILLMEDLHIYFDAPDYREIIGHLRTLPRIADIEGKSRKNIILSQPIPALPLDLEKDVFVMDVPLPDRRLLAKVIKEVVSELELDDDKAPEGNRKNMAEAALGLTLSAAKLTFKEIALANGRLTSHEIPLILDMKEQIIKKGGILEYYHPSFHLSDVGGMENLKLWLKNRKAGFNPDAQEFGLNSPKGILLLGVQGCGKGCITKAIAADWNIPLLRLDIGEVFSAKPGESFRTVRRAHKIATAVAPSILWIEGIEKVFTGEGRLENFDGNIRARASGDMISWMLDKRDLVFIIATANSIEHLPPELLRKGRFDEIFYIDLPGQQARKDIWRTHLKRRLKGRIDIKQFNPNTLSNISSGYTGAEIEEAINEALYRAYNGKRELQMDDLTDAIQTIYPLSKVMTKRIMKLRDWAKVRTKLASLDIMEPISYEKKIIPILKQEAGNPFIN